MRVLTATNDRALSNRPTFPEAEPNRFIDSVVAPGISVTHRSVVSPRVKSVLCALPSPMLQQVDYPLELAQQQQVHEVQCAFNSTTSARPAQNCYKTWCKTAKGVKEVFNRPGRKSSTIGMTMIETKKGYPPDRGLEPRTTRLKAWRSTD